MDTTVDALIVDLLSWLELRERTYEEALDAWRTSCPKFPVWEDAHDRGLVTKITDSGREIVRVTPAGMRFLQQHRRGAAPESSRLAELG